MVEGHLAHRYARQCAQKFAGKRVTAHSPNSKFEQGAANINGKVFKKAEANGKHIFLWFECEILHLHMGMFGSFHFRKPETKPRENTSYKLSFECEEWAVDIKAPITCEIGTEEDRQAVFARLGPDPLRDDATPERFWQCMQTSHESIGALLLDQRAISGLGNIYCAEVLFLAAIHPNVAASSLSRQQFEKIWKISADLLRSCSDSGSIITVRDQEVKDPAKRTWHDRYYVYKKKNCRRCASKVRNWASASRRIFACETCQTPPQRDPSVAETELYPVVPKRKTKAEEGVPARKTKKVKVECAWGGITFAKLGKAQLISEEEEAIKLKVEGETKVTIKREKTTKRKKIESIKHEPVEEAMVLIKKEEDVNRNDDIIEVVRRKSSRIHLKQLAAV